MLDHPGRLRKEALALRPSRPGLGLVEEVNDSICVSHNQLVKAFSSFNLSMRNSTADSLNVFGCL